MNEGKRILVNDLVTSNCANYKTCLFVHLVFLSEVFGDMQVAVAHISIKLLSYEKLFTKRIKWYLDQIEFWKRSNL